MHHFPVSSTLSFAFLSLAPLLGQDALKVDHFLPNDYENIVRIDLKALRDTGVWDELANGVMQVMLAQIEQEVGFALGSIDRVTVVPMMSASASEGAAAKEHQVLVVEGNSELAVPDSVARSGSYVDESIGIYDVMRRQGHLDEVFFRPRPEVQISGSTSLLRPMLEGRTRAGLPCPDIMSLLAGRRGALLYVVLHVADETLEKRVVSMLFPDTEWPADDGMQFMMLRLNAIGDPDDPNIELELVIRHGKDGEGLKVTEKAVAALIERAVKEPQMRLLAPLLEGIVTKRDRADLDLRLDLGRGRAAAGRLTMLALPMMMFGTPVEAQALPAVEAAPVEAAPAPAPENPGKKK